MKICDRCAKKAHELIDIKPEYGGGEVCKTCLDASNAFEMDFTRKYIKPLIDKRKELTIAFLKGFKLVD